MRWHLRESKHMKRDVWFAWLPVKVSDIQAMVWLECVERLTRTDSIDGNYYEYYSIKKQERQIGQKEKESL